MVVVDASANPLLAEVHSLGLETNTVIKSNHNRVARGFFGRYHHQIVENTEELMQQIAGSRSLEEELYFQ